MTTHQRASRNIKPGGPSGILRKGCPRHVHVQNGVSMLLVLRVRAEAVVLEMVVQLDDVQDARLADQWEEAGGRRVGGSMLQVVLSIYIGELKIASMFQST